MEISLALSCIAEAVKQIRRRRYFNSERGFGGQLQANLERLLRENRVIPEEAVVEEECQKRKDNHDMIYRPDIVVHIPIEAGITRSRKEGNFIAFELKLRANKEAALEAFKKLNAYLTKLHYELSVFVNINSDESFIELANNEKIHVFNSVWNNREVFVTHSYLRGQEAVIKIL